MSLDATLLASFMFTFEIFANHAALGFSFLCTLLLPKFQLIIVLTSTHVVIALHPDPDKRELLLLFLRFGVTITTGGAKNASVKLSF